MNTDALRFIDAIASNMTETKKPLREILAVLEDGSALFWLGVDDEDQPMVEDAHSIVSDWLDAGKITLDQVV